jgi:hypothetical protein
MARVAGLARARQLDRPETAYIVRSAGRDGIVETELTWPELARDTAWIAGRLRAAGLAAGHRVLLTGSGEEGPWLRPTMDALCQLGVTYGIAEAMGWDANRTAVFTRELDLHGVIGLSRATVERLGDGDALRRLFGAIPVMLARPDAVPLLAAAGVSAGVICLLGPALAVECGQRHGAHVNAEEWRVWDRGGELWIAAGASRAGRLGDTPLALRGGVTTQPCPCGSTDPRVSFAV